MLPCIPRSAVARFTQTVYSNYKAAFQAGLQAVRALSSDGSRPPPLLPHIYGSAEYLGDSLAGLGPPDKPATGASAQLVSACFMTHEAVMKPHRLCFC